MLDLITFTRSGETLTSTRAIIYVNYDEYIIQNLDPFQQIN
jgi:hypothetical protein